MTDELRAELAGLASSVRAFLELHDMTGTTGLPISEASPSLVEAPFEARMPSGTRPVAPAPRAELAGRSRASVSRSRRSASSSPRERPAPQAPPTRPAPSGDDERVTRLALLAERTRGCEKCVLCQKRKQAVFARGNPFSELCFVGEGPGADEDAQGEPFVGKAGQLLDRMIAAMGYAARRRLLNLQHR